MFSIASSIHTQTNWMENFGHRARNTVKKVINNINGTERIKLFSNDKWAIFLTK